MSMKDWLDNYSAGGFKGPARPIGGVWAVPAFSPSRRRRWRKSKET